MSPILRSKVSEVLIKYNFSAEDAQFLANLLEEIDDRQRSEFESKLELLLTQKDKTELTLLIQQTKAELLEQMQLNKAELTLRLQQTTVDLTSKITQVESRLVKQVYIVGLIQFLAIVGALIGIINFALS